MQYEEAALLAKPDVVRQHHFPVRSRRYHRNGTIPEEEFPSAGLVLGWLYLARDMIVDVDHRAIDHLKHMVSRLWISSAGHKDAISKEEGCDVERASHVDLARAKTVAIGQYLALAKHFLHFPHGMNVRRGQHEHLLGRSSAGNGGRCLVHSVVDFTAKHRRDEAVAAYGNVGLWLWIRVAQPHVAKALVEQPRHLSILLGALDRVEPILAREIKPIPVVPPGVRERDVQRGQRRRHRFYLPGPRKRTGPKSACPGAAPSS